jgi:Fe-S cluster assembly ATPase SufC
MPNSEPKIYPFGSRQKRIENFNALVEFLLAWKKGRENLDNAQAIAERFCNVNFQYGYVSRNDIVIQALMKANLL